MKLLTVSDVAELTGLSTVKIRSLIKAQKLLAIDTSTGNRPTYLIRECDLEAFLTPAAVDPKQAPAKRPAPRKRVAIDAHVPNVFGKKNREKLRKSMRSTG